MTTTYLGGLTIGDLLPGVGVPMLALMADLQARLTALLEFKPTLSISFDDMLTINASIAASIEAALAIGLQPPTLSLQIQVVADLSLALQLQLELLLEFMKLLLVPSVHTWHYTGRADTLGSDMSTTLAGGLPGGAGPAENINALIIATGAADAWNALAQIFKTTP